MRNVNYFLFLLLLSVGGMASAAGIDDYDLDSAVITAGIAVAAVGAARWGIDGIIFLYKVATKGVYDPNNKYHNGARDDW